MAKEAVERFRPKATELGLARDNLSLAETKLRLQKDRAAQVTAQAEFETNISKRRQELATLMEKLDAEQEAFHTQSKANIDQLDQAIANAERQTASLMPSSTSATTATASTSHNGPAQNVAPNVDPTFVLQIQQQYQAVQATSDPVAANQQLVGLVGIMMQTLGLMTTPAPAAEITQTAVAPVAPTPILGQAASSLKRIALEAAPVAEAGKEQDQDI